MTLTKIKQSISSILPKKIKKRVKTIYYDNFLYPLYNLKYKFFYNSWDFFDSISLETTTYCNLRCKFCPNSIYERGLLKNKKLMDSNLFKKIINELRSINYRGKIRLHFYGEPLSDSRLPELIKYIRDKCPRNKVIVYTNGFLLTIELYQKLIKIGVNSFFITQYGTTKIPNIEKLMTYLKTRPKYENKITYRTLGVDLGLSNRGGEIKVKNTVDYERPTCLYPSTSLHIDYLGNLVLCSNDYHSTIIFGNLKKEKLLDIWNKPNYKKLRNELKHYIFKLPICKKCVGLE